MKNYAIYVVLAIVVGVGAVFLYNNYAAGGKQMTEEGSTTQTPTGDDSSLVVENPVYENTIAISEFTPGNTVTFESVNMSTPGFVIVHEATNGQAGAIIGTSSLYQAGPSENVVVNLTRPSEKDETLYVMIHTDDGDGTFNAATDAVASDNQGNPATIEFPVGLE